MTDSATDPDGDVFRTEGATLKLRELVGASRIIGRHAFRGIRAISNRNGVLSIRYLELKVRVDGQLVFNSTHQILNAALVGLGLAYAPEDMVKPFLASGRLIRVLEDWCEPYSGYHLYYPSRRHVSPAFSLLVDALRYPGPSGERRSHPQDSLKPIPTVPDSRAAPLRRARRASPT